MYEPETQHAMREFLKAGDDFIIAGAHRGVLASVAASVVGPQGKVFAFEPEKENFACLTEAIKDFDNVYTFNHALGDRDCRAPLFYNSDNDGGHALWDVTKLTNNYKSQENPISYEIDVKTLDSLEQDFSNVKMMLFDVEGSEHAVLKGAINTIVDYEIPFIICEVNNPALERCGTSQNALKSFLAVHGYKIFTLMPNTIKEIKADDEVILSIEEDDIVFNILFVKKRSH